MIMLRFTSTLDSRARAVYSLRALRVVTVTVHDVFRMSRATSYLARSPSSLIFCGVRNTHTFQKYLYLAFYKFSEEFGQCPSPS